MFTLVNKLGLALIRTTNYRLEDGKKKKQKRKDIVKKQKAETIAAKRRRARNGISLSSAEGRNYKSDIKDDIDLDKANHRYPL